MPKPGKMWRHVILSTRRSWLHGDARGFRSRKHRIHSSGDYKNPPPEGEHAGLLAYHKDRAKAPMVRIKKPLRGQLGAAILHVLLALGYRVLVVSVSAKHAHALVELPRDRARVKRIMGRCKTARTPAVRRAMPGSIWGEGGKFKPVKDRDHHSNAFKYIRDEQGLGAWTWTFQDPVPPDPRKRKRDRNRDRNPKART